MTLNPKLFRTPNFSCNCGNLVNVPIYGTLLYDTGYNCRIKVECNKCGKNYVSEPLENKKDIDANITFSSENVAKIPLSETVIKSNNEFINKKFNVLDDGIYKSVDAYTSKMIMSKETFIEAYNKYIKGE